jgi:hypothetical protein
MNLFGKLFKKKKDYNTNNKYKLLVIDEKAELIHLNLGINDKRADELLHICLTAYKENQVLYTALENIVDKCNHTNELVFSSMIFQKVIDRENSKNELLNHLKSMLGHG